LVGLYSCDSNENQENNQVDDSQMSFEPYNQKKWDTNASEFLYKGNLIQLEQEGKYEIQAVEHQRGDVSYKAQRIPTELYLKNKGLDGEELAAAMEDTKEEQLFYFDFQESQKQDLMKKYFANDPDAGVGYMAFGVDKDFYLISTSGDTIPAAFSHYERNFHVAPYERLILSFKGVDQNEEVQLFYQDQLFGKGMLAFTFASTNYLENNFKNPS
jgi:hypothetical protein